MSRLAKRPIALPEKTELALANGSIVVKGAKGTLSRPSHRLVSIEMVEGGAQVSPKDSSLAARALLGTYASHVRNMLHGVSAGFSKKLLIEGVGYKWEVIGGKKVNLSLGFSHPVSMDVPEGLTVVAERATLTISGSDKEMVGQFAANVRALKKPEPYKGKGIRYEGEVVRRKAGKKSV